MSTRNLPQRPPAPQVSGPPAAGCKAKEADIDTRRIGVGQEPIRLDEQQRHVDQVKMETAALLDYGPRVRLQLQRFDLTEQRLALAALNLTVV